LAATFLHYIANNASSHEVTCKTAAMYKIATYNQGREHKNQFNCHFSGNPDSQSPITFVLSILTGQAKILHTSFL